MKRLLCLGVLALSLMGYSQSSFVVRPAVGNPDLVASGSKGSGTVMVTIPVYNNSFSVPVRAGSGHLEVDLGAVGSSVEVVQLPSGGAFVWDKPVLRDGHSFVTGTLAGTLAANYAGNETFVLRATSPVNTMVRVQWIEAVPQQHKRPDTFAEIQVQGTDKQLTTTR